MEGFRRCFSLSRPVVIAMIHVPALPGTPKSRLSFPDIVKAARGEADIYRRCGVLKLRSCTESQHDPMSRQRWVVMYEGKQIISPDQDAVMVENMHDVPYLTGDQNGPEVTAAMTAVCREVKAVFRGPVGVQILAAANRQALAVALAADLQFIRAECFVFSHVADEGLMNACAGELLRYRKHIGAESVLVFTDVKKKHSSHSITADVSLAETAAAAEMFLSDGVIVTGSCTGKQADPAELTTLKDSTSLPVLVGSGITADNIPQYATADGLIVGSHFKRHGLWSNEIVVDTVTRFMDVVNTLRKTGVTGAMQS